MAANNSNSPRQKMINLMYLVFIAMLALNVPAEVLDGFELVEESLLQSVKSSTSRNNLIYEDISDYHEQNREKTRDAFRSASEVQARSDSLFNYIESLKKEIVIDADGIDGDPSHLKHPGNLSASTTIMIEGKEGEKLKGLVDEYRTFVTGIIRDPEKREMIMSNLSTEPSAKAKREKKSWINSNFEQMPLAAAVTILTKLQNDIRYAQGEILTLLLAGIDMGDYRVNKIKAYVIPETKIVMQGVPTNANIILAAEDTTQRPEIYVGNTKLDSPDGVYTLPAGAPGPKSFSGRIEMKTREGVQEFPFSLDYMVIQPGASISPVLMNVVYKGIPNEFNIAVPGVPSQNITATMTNGSLVRSGEKWIVNPGTIGQDAVITVSANMGKHTLVMGTAKLRVRPLPPANAFFEYTDASGAVKQFKGGRISKAALVNVNGLKAAIDDGILNIPFSVLRFETVIWDSMGNTLRAPSNGGTFSQQQKDAIRGLSRGKSFFIRGIKAMGPDGVEQDLAVMEVIVN